MRPSSSKLPAALKRCSTAITVRAEGLFFAVVTIYALHTDPSITHHVADGQRLGGGPSNNAEKKRRWLRRVSSLCVGIEAR